MQSDETLFITFWNNVCSPTSERALLADLSMTSRCGVACILIAAAVSTFAMTAIISAVTAESDSPTGELGTDPNHVYGGGPSSRLALGGGWLEVEDNLGGN